MEKLKPCPFCGNKKPNLEKMSDGGFCVKCSNNDCHCSFGDNSWGSYHIGEGANEGEFSSPLEATIKWNTRLKTAE